ncbi:hypothetical protein A5821_001321 [Enterococcus sp. 7F3_DIV0205]|uniref:DUF1310 family protein n=1 Tax=Candidatus Enterococcus palustris TaxID=1834189 RepID=A0AAQ3W7S4_9ENTE|nr:DUF1310 family protein [Enterococcus sp. 7F3_DIV0205]OTN85719.1 hypothetical protein A5821_001665 [Enterococcus sp. 7F3_DIV0205]
MKSKQLKYLVVVIVTIMVIGIGIGGKIYMDRKTLKDEMLKIVTDNKDIVEKELKAQDTSNRIHKIDIDYSTIKHNPMGGIMFEGYINGEKKLAFSTGLNKYVMSETGEYSDVQSTGVDITKELDHYLSGGRLNDR